MAEPHRIVEMYQWREQSEGSGDNRSTRYERSGRKGGSRHSGG